ncbi:MAG: Mut7-C RNAse domain-containing protein [Deltaproteobacteria bacterium]|nr:Mut7-C RNAse domain-containing protein [Deltaproteobacteria bacterium]
MQYRFIADTMLGKLARWMRMIGCDVEYFPKISDRELVERAYRSGRIILTRDTRLIQRRKARNNHCFVQGDSYKDQLRQVVKRFSIGPGTPSLTRCLLCNKLLLDIDKGSVEGKVPPYVYETQDSFKTCPACGRLYWGATHKDEMVRQLKEILRGIS